MILEFIKLKFKLHKNYYLIELIIIIKGGNYAYMQCIIRGFGYSGAIDCSNILASAIAATARRYLRLSERETEREEYIWVFMQIK